MHHDDHADPLGTVRFDEIWAAESVPDENMSGKAMESLADMDEDVVGRRILIVDDTKTNITVLLEMLRGDYTLGVATSGEKALEYVAAQQPDLILLDVMMPGLNGYQVCQALKDDPATRDIPVIFISAVKDVRNKTQGFAAGGVDYITKPFEAAEVKARVRTHLDLKLARERLRNQNALLDRRVRERTLELRNTQIEVVTRLCLAAEFRDTDTGCHVKRISHYCAILAERLGMPSKERELIFHASSMHDLGKIGIPDHILLKPGKLTAEEWVVMRRHCEIGAGMLGGGTSNLLRLAHAIALTHHERWDGAGYPARLAGTDIPLAGRITSLCDVFDALTNRRPYKEPWPPEAAVQEILAGRGTQFDPDVVDAFATELARFRIVLERFGEAE